MAGRQRTFLFACGMLVFAAGITGVVIRFLYQSALAETRVRLTDVVRTQAYLLESLGRLEGQPGATGLPGGVFAVTLGLTQFGRSGEFTLARREGDSIVFLLRHRTAQLEHPAPVPLRWDRVEPMRRGLAGQSGTWIGADYRGEIVLAAYDYVPQMEVGIVAQIDLAEIRQPFVRAAVIAAAVTLVLVALGAGLFVRVSNPFIRRLESRVAQRTADLARANDELQNEIAERLQVEQQLLHHREQLRSLAAELALTEERERRRIATDLHDHISQTLAVTQMKIDALGVMAEGPQQQEYLSQISAYIDQMDEDIRTLTFQLSPPVLHELGLAAGVRWQAEQLQAQHDIRITVADDSQTKPLHDDTLALAFRAIRELLMNVVKHARARNAAVRLWREEGRIHAVVQDDGVGFQPGDSPRVDLEDGFGLFSVRERINSIGGTLDIESSPGSGTRVHVTVPLQSDPQLRKEVR